MLYGIETQIKENSCELLRPADIFAGMADDCVMQTLYTAVQYRPNAAMNAMTDRRKSNKQVIVQLYPIPINEENCLRAM